MRVSLESLTGSQARSIVATKFLRLNWGAVPNEQEQDFTATDLWLMARDARRFDMGALIGAQVKGGTSWFSSPAYNDDKTLAGWWYPDTKSRFDTWATHRVPHILVLHNPETERSYWVDITAETVVDTGKGAKILVPHDSTVDDDHINQLLEVATRDVSDPGWEGSSWNRRTIAERDRLRYALLTPRLIAPHPNLHVEQLTPEEGIALLTEMRVGGLTPSPLPGATTKTPGLQACRDSDNWWWRFYAALYDVLIDTQSVEALAALVDADGAKPYEKAAAAATVATLLMELGRPDDSISVLEPLIQDDNCEPVDHNWLLMLKARCLSELGDTDAATGIAIEVQQLRPLTRSDPTAGALVGSSSGLILALSLTRAQSVSDFVAARDTLAAWWRSQEIATGLQHQFDEDYRRWTHDSSITIGGSDQTWLSFRAAALTSGLAGDHTAWRGAFVSFARRVLLTSADNGDEVAFALNGMRLAGDGHGLTLAATHLLQVGPVSAVKAAVSHIDLDGSTRTALLASIEFIRCAADVLDTDYADRHAQWALRVLNDPEELAARLKPTFVIPLYVLGMLAALVPGLSPQMLRQVIEHITGLDIQQDGSTANRYAVLIASIPQTAWLEEDLDQLASRQGDDFQLAESFESVLAAASPAARASLLDKISDGNLRAVAAYGDLADLPTATVTALVAKLIDQVERQIAELKNSQSADRAIEPASVLAAINVQHPEQADWSPIVGLLGTLSPFTSHLDNLLRMLRRIAPRINADAAGQLAPTLRSLLETPPAFLFPGHRDIRGAAGAALAAINSDAVTDSDIWDLMNGPSHLRAAAAMMVTSRAHPQDMGILASLAFDNTPEVRTTAASCLTYWMTHGVAVAPSLAVLAPMLKKDGIGVARAIAHALAGAELTEETRELANLLLDHPSQYVRSVAAKHT